jgi:hypothetical protein
MHFASLYIQPKPPSFDFAQSKGQSLKLALGLPPVRHPTVANKHQLSKGHIQQPCTSSRCFFLPVSIVVISSDINGSIVALGSTLFSNV